MCFLLKDDDFKDDETHWRDRVSSGFDRLFKLSSELSNPRDIDDFDLKSDLIKTEDLRGNRPIDRISSAKGKSEHF